MKRNQINKEAFGWESFFKKIYSTLLLICLLSPVKVSALTLESPIKHRTFGELLNAIINFFFTVSLILVPLFIVIGGFYFVSSVGDIKKVETGKKIILYALIGFLIILLAKGLVALLMQVIGAPAGGGSGSEAIGI